MLFAPHENALGGIDMKASECALLALGAVAITYHGRAKDLGREQDEERYVAGTVPVSIVL